MDKSSNESNYSQVNSLNKKRVISFNLSNFLILLLIIVFSVFSFILGDLYRHNIDVMSEAKLSVLVHSHQKFLLGTVVYISSNKIVVSQMSTGNIKNYILNKNTLISLNGTPGAVSQIKAGELALVRTISVYSNIAKVVLVNTYATSTN